MEDVLFFKILPYLVNGIGIILAITSAIFIYLGLSTRSERIQTRYRIQESIRNSKRKIAESANSSKTEEWMKKANHPGGISALVYNTSFYLLIIFLILYYIAYPILIGNSVSIFAILAIVGVYLLLLPNFPYSLFVYVIKRIIDYQESKKNGEIFMLYDFLINELESMKNNRINTYNVLRSIKPYFNVLESPLNKLLTNWSNDQGPKVALDHFAEEVGTKEAHSLVNIIKTLDEVEVDVALDSLRGMNTMFIRSQIENYRRRRKVTTDLASIPIKVTHYIILLNVLAVVIAMVTIFLKANTL